VQKFKYQPESMKVYLFFFIIIWIWHFSILDTIAFPAALCNHSNVKETNYFSPTHLSFHCTM